LQIIFILQKGGVETSKKSPFRHVGVKRYQSSDIESLFKDLRNRSPKIRDLYSAQADVLRDYQTNHLKSSDVSIELPTGSGKTLVGLLIAEYRRRILGERVVYICPTKQLAYQVGNKSIEYTIPTKVLVGPKRDYNQQDVHLYRSAHVIAVSTYSGIFNTNPEFSNAQTIVLDDAHGGESYISALWSLVITRDETPEIYTKVLSIYEKDLPSYFVSVLHSSTRPQNVPKPEKIPFGVFYTNLENLRSMLDSSLTFDVADLYFPWQLIRNGLQACHAYISWDQILIRPYIPPTLTHAPFAGANQRVYMSATLGRGGELERITGIPRINRIQTPKTYLRRGIGRRLFIFPDLVDNFSGYESWLVKTISSSERTLALCPTGISLHWLKKTLKQSPTTLRILGASDIEESLDPFSTSNSVVLALANRYDGIDIPSEDCRLLIMNGLPAGTNLQEVFLEDKLGLDVLLRERVKTRISQGAGRCTRSDTDNAVIFMLGRRLLDFCMKNENQSLFNNELRAEIRFSLDQKIEDLGTLDSMIRAFFDKDENWAAAEQNIVELRESEALPDPIITDILADIVTDEINFSYCVWSGRYKDAIKHGNNITDKLTDSRLSSYRALWFYFTAFAAHAASKDDNNYSKVAERLMSRAIQTSKTVSWFANALKSMLPSDKIRSVASPIETMATEGIADKLHDLGSSGPGFTRKIEEVESLLQQKKHSKFDRGMKELGDLLGFTSWQPSSMAAPDCIWQLGSEVAFLLEGKSEASPDGPISVADCRQASGHLKWATAQEQLKDCKSIFSVLVSPRTVLDKIAIPHAGSVYLMTPDDMRALFGRTKAMLTTVRSTMIDEYNEEFKERIMAELVQTDLTPDAIQKLLLSKPATL
jgi:hypothetical protein